MRRGLIVAALSTALALPAAAAQTSGAAPPHASFIVVLESDTADVRGVAAGLARGAGGEVGHVYEHAIKGFQITASDQAAAALARNPRVAYVERDRQVTLDAQTVPTGIDRIFATANGAIDIDGQDDLRVDVDVAVIDTGVDFEHPDLDVVGGVDCTTGPWWWASCTGGGDDDHYHGTHVAGSIAALDDGNGVVGVAPGARIHAVKVLDSGGSGFTSWIVAGIDWVAGNPAIEVANMSLGGSGFSQAEYDAIQGAVDNGVAFAVAAGNSAAPASNYSPAAFDNVLTTSALADFDGVPGGLGSATCRADEDDTLANFSNYGSAVDIAAPGVCILSTFPVEDGSYGTISGTSMASPHAAGALALLASANNPNDAADVGALYASVIGAGNFGWTDDSGDGILEPLLDVTGFVPAMIPGSGGGPVNQAPSVSITSPTDGATYASGSTIPLTATTSDPDGDPVTVSWTANGAPIADPYSPADGTHEVVATADDGNGGTATDMVTITVGDPPPPPPPPPPTSLTPSSINNGKTWTAVVTYAGPSGTGVAGTWSTGAAGSCTIAAGASSCDVTLPGIRKKVRSVTFTTTDGTQVVVHKP